MQTRQSRLIQLFGGRLDGQRLMVSLVEGYRTIHVPIRDDKGCLCGAVSYELRGDRWEHVPRDGGR